MGEVTTGAVKTFKCKTNKQKNKWHINYNNNYPSSWDILSKSGIVDGTKGTICSHQQNTMGNIMMDKYTDHKDKWKNVNITAANA